MLLSIIVPLYNEAVALPELLEHLEGLKSLEAAEGRNIELIFVDGGSTDDSRERIAAAGFECLNAERGRANQMNAGAAAATGDVFLFLHADTQLDRAAMAAARTSIERGAIGGYFEVRLASKRPLLRLVGRMISWRSRISGVASGDQAIFVTRWAFETVGGYPPLPLFEDIDLSRRLRRVGRFAALDVPVVTSSRRWEHGGAVPTILRMWTLRVLYYCGVSARRLARYYGDAR